MKTGKIVLVAIFAASLMLLAGTAFADGLMPQIACPSGYIFTPVPGIISNGMQMGYCTSAAPPPPQTVACSGVPVITITGLSPEEITARNSKSIDITVTGQVTLPQNCTLGNVEYVLSDEYGQNNGAGTVSVSDGQFAAVVPIKASRKGSDKDGRLYTITVSAGNEYGTGQSAPVSVTVAHDNRK